MHFASHGPDDLRLPIAKSVFADKRQKNHLCDQRFISSERFDGYNISFPQTTTNNFWTPTWLLPSCWVCWFYPPTIMEVKKMATSNSQPNRWSLPPNHHRPTPHLARERRITGTDAARLKLLTFWLTRSLRGKPESSNTLGTCCEEPNFSSFFCGHGCDDGHHVSGVKVRKEHEGGS